MFGLGVSELIIIGVIILLIFGARRLPAIGRGLGETVKEIKNVSKDLKGEHKKQKISRPQKPEEPDGDGPSESTSAKGGIDSIPGVEEFKTVRETASQVRKWWRFLKH